MVSTRSESTSQEATPTVRPAWLKSRKSAGNGAKPSEAVGQPGATAGPTVPPVQAENAKPVVRPRTIGGWLALAWQLFLEWWNGLYLGWGVTVSFAAHALVFLILGLTYFTINSDRGMLIGGTFDEVQDGDLDVLLNAKLENNYGDEAASLQFSATSALTDRETLQSAENLLSGTLGDGEDAGEGEASMAMNIRVPESAITRGSFTVWTEPEDPKPRVPYDIVIQVKLPPSVKSYRLTDLSGSVTGTDGYRKQIKYTSKDRKGVKDGVAQLTIRIPGAAQLVKDVIEIRSRILEEEQTIEIVF